MNPEVLVDASAVATARVHSVADALWQIKLEHPYRRLNSGLPATTIPAGTQGEARHEATRAASLLEDLHGIDEHLLAESDRLTLGFLRHDLSQMAQAEISWLNSSPVAPYSSMHFVYYAQHLLANKPVDSAESLELAAGLWSDLATAIKTVAIRVAAQASLGRRLAQPALKPTIDSWRRMHGQLVSLLEGGRGLGMGPWLNRWSEQLDRLRDRELRPAFELVIGALSDASYAAAAPAAVGLMHLPGGLDEYRRLLVTHLTVVDDPERIHAVGHAEVARLTDRMREVRSRMGFDGSEAAFHASLKTHPKVIASTAEDVSDRYLRAMQRMDAVLTAWFHTQPRSPYSVERLPIEQEAGMTYGYYDKPKVVGERGVYWYNASNLEHRSQLQVAALVYHELAPGHHFHLARQMELDHLPALRSNALELSVFNEGWAEYASGLAEEMGLYDDPYDLYGRLVHERFVAQRLVVDTGLNALGWTLDQARAFMRENTLEGEAQIASETLRYSTDLPAQALAYRLGYLWFMQARQEAKERQGTAFDIRDFHESVLGEGALPLPVLSGHLTRVLR